MRHIRPQDLPADAGAREALGRFCREARELAGARLGSIILFGSMARGDASQYSDVDVWVDWNGPEAEGQAMLLDLAGRLFFETGVLVSPHVVSPSHRARLASWNTAFYRNVQAEGLVVDA